MQNIIRKFTGTTGGETPIKDGAMRTALVGILNGALGFAGVSHWLSAEQVAILATVINPLVFFAFGVWDRIMGPAFKIQPLRVVGDDRAASILPVQPMKVHPEQSIRTEPDPPTITKAASTLPEDGRIQPKHRPARDQHPSPGPPSNPPAPNKPKRKR